MKRKFRIKSKKFESKVEQLMHFTGKSLADCKYALMTNGYNLKKASKKLKK